MDQTPFTRFDPAVLIRVARDLDADAPVHVNPAYAESLRRVAEYAWLEGYAGGSDDALADEYRPAKYEYHDNPYEKEEQ